MGYTHYYFNVGVNDPAKWLETFPLLLEDTKKLIEGCGTSYIGGLMGEGGEPTLTEHKIAFNGIGEESHESFILRSGGDHDMGFTKTARKHYDAVVTAVLLRIVFRMGKDSKDARAISSDGDWNDWEEGRDLVKKVFPNDEVIRPPGVREAQTAEQE